MPHLKIVPILAFMLLLREGIASDQQGPSDASEAAQSVYRKYMAHFQRGDYRAALTVAEDGLRINPSNSDLHELVGHAYIAQQEVERAMHAYTKAIHFGSRSFHVYNNRGCLYSRRRDWVHAIEDFCEAIAIDPDKPEAYYGRAEAYLGQSRYAEARADYEASYKRGYGNLAVYSLARFLACCPDALIRDGRKALEYARMICHPTDFKESFSLDVLAMSLAEVGQWEEAVRRAEQALKLAERRKDIDGGCCAGIRMRLELYRLHEPYRQMPPECSSNWSPSSAIEALLHGVSKIEIADYKGACKDLQVAIEMNPRLSSAHYALGCAMSRMYYTNDAIRHFNQCLEMDNGNAEALYDRAIAHCILCKYDNALSDATRALSMNPRNFLARLSHAWALGGLGKGDQALKELAQLNREYPENEQICVVRGDCYLQQGRFDDAVTEFTNVIERASRYALAFAGRAVALSALRRSEEAKRDLEMCIHLAPPLERKTQARIKAMQKR